MNFYENESYVEARSKLKDEYAIAFHKAETYIHTRDYGLLYEEPCMMQILDDFLCAQQEDRPLSAIIGPDLRKFCDMVMKAEMDRLRNRKIYYIELITIIPFSLMLLIFFRSFLFHKHAFSSQNLQSLHITGFDLFFVSLFPISYLTKKLVTRLLFNHTRLVKISLISTFVGLIIMMSILMEEIDIRTPLFIPISFPVFLILFILSMILFVVCIWITNKNREKWITISYDENNSEDEMKLEQVICPICGNEHDYDYPKCPYCKHKYFI